MPLPCLAPPASPFPDVFVAEERSSHALSLSLSSSLHLPPSISAILQVSRKNAMVFYVEDPPGAIAGYAIISTRLPPAPKGGNVEKVCVAEAMWEPSPAPQPLASRFVPAALAIHL